MPNDLYDLLQVPPNANLAWLRRAADLRKAEIRHDTALTEEQKTVSLRAVDDALRTLSDPVRRARYDERLSPPARPSLLGQAVAALISPVGILCIIVLMLGGGYAMHNARQERLRLEAEELRISQEAELARKEIERREEETRQRLEEAEAHRAALREEQQRRQYERERRSIGAAASAEQIEARNEAQRINAARQAQLQAEANQRREEAEARARAREESLRRQRFLRERERKY